MADHAGEKNRQIIIESLSVARGSFNEVAETWSTYATCWAKKEDIGGRERFQAARELAVREARFYVWWRSGLTEGTYRINEGGTIWDITGIREIGWREEIEITATRKDS